MNYVTLSRGINVVKVEQWRLEPNGKKIYLSLFSRASSLSGRIKHQRENYELVTFYDTGFK